MPGLSLHEAQRQAYARLYGTLLSQASTMSYIDTYWILTVVACLMFLFWFTLKKNNPNPAEKPLLDLAVSPVRFRSARSSGLASPCQKCHRRFRQPQTIRRGK